MADLKISQLPNASTPLAGTEVLPIVQAGVTDKVTVDNLLARLTTEPPAIGTTTPAAGSFTTLAASGNVTLGDAATDTCNIGNGGIVKDASGNTIVGASATFIGLFGGTNKFSVTGLGGSGQSYFGANAVGARYDFLKSRSATTGAHTILQSGDEIGSSYFGGSDGTNFKPAASIAAFVDGTPGTNDMPGRLVFSTTSDGAGSPTERMRIDNGGFTKVQSFGQNLITNTAATYTVLTTDGTIVQTTTGSTYTLPAAASYTGRKLHLLTQFAGAVISASSNVVPIAGGAAGTAILAATAGKFATLQSNGTNWLIVAAN